MKKMKPARIILMLLALCMAFTILPLTGLAAATNITTDFTDANFLNAVREKIGKTHGEPIYDSDVNTMTALNVNSKGITSLNGIQHLTALKTLNCNNNRLTALDLSVLSKLETLQCGMNQLKTLDLRGLSKLGTLYCGENQLTALNLSGLEQFWYLDCNKNNLISLNLSGLSKLETLYCYQNQLTALDLSGLEQLKKLDCNNNSLLSLDASGLSQLKDLDCVENQLTALNLSGLSQLEDLDCRHNQLTALNLSGLSKLKNLYCSYNQLTTLNLSGLNSLDTFDCSCNCLTSLTGLPSSLKYLYCHRNRLASLDVTGLNLSALYCSYNWMTAPADVTGFTGTWETNYCLFSPQHVNHFKAVTNIIGVPKGIPVNATIKLPATAVPDDAEHKTITWSIVEDAGTGAVLNGNILTTSNTGTVRIDALVTDGFAPGSGLFKSFTVKVKPSHTLTASAGTGGSISPTGETSVIDGGNQTFTITANPTYEIAEVLVDGVSVGAVSSYTFQNITANHIITASFKIVPPSHTITASAGKGGGISPAGETAVLDGSDQTFTITANPTYEIAEVLVDGVSVGAVSSYTFQNITANHIITASFKIVPPSHTITASAGQGGSISPAGETVVIAGNNQTFTVTANPKYEIADVRVDGASAGAVNSYTFQNITAAHTIEASFKIINPFIDVTSTDWFYDEVLNVYVQDLMLGTAPDKFSPNYPMNRAMAVTVLYRLSGETATTDNIFSDVPAGSWYEEAVAWGAANNIVLGVGNQKFDPMANVTREQMATFLYRYANYKGKEVTSADTKFNTFNDNTKAAEYAVPSLKWACENDLLRGYGNNILSPQSAITRAENAALFQRFMAMP